MASTGCSSNIVPRRSRRRKTSPAFPELMDFRDWRFLPDDVLSLIAQRIPDIRDFVRLRGVCRPWNSVVTAVENYVPDAAQIPWLLLLLPRNNAAYFDMSELSVHPLRLPERTWLYGCSHGWFVLATHDLRMYLLNPLSYKCTKLPRFFVPLFLTTKMIISNSPTSGDRCMVMAIHGLDSELAIAEPGDDAWMKLNLPVRFFTDVIHHRGMYMAINVEGIVVGVYINEHRSWRMWPIGGKVAEGRMAHRRCMYLVHADDKLFAVVRYAQAIGMGSYRTFLFEVYVLMSEDNELTWVQIDNIGDQTIFLGLSESMSLSTKKTGWLRNCIYFCDECRWHRSEESKDVGVFSLDSGAVQPYYRGIGASPLWFMPKIW